MEVGEVGCGWAIGPVEWREYCGCKHMSPFFWSLGQVCISPGRAKMSLTELNCHQLIAVQCLLVKSANVATTETLRLPLDGIYGMHNGARQTCRFFCCQKSKTKDFC